MAVDVQPLIDKVNEQKTVVEGVKTFVTQLKEQLNAELANDADAQAKVNQVFADMEANNQSLADAMVANTPNA